MPEDRACTNREDLPSKDLGDCLLDAWHIYGLLVAADMISEEATSGSPDCPEATALVSVVRVAVEQQRALALELDRIHG